MVKFDELISAKLSRYISVRNAKKLEIFVLESGRTIENRLLLVWETTERKRGRKVERDSRIGSPLQKMFWRMVMFIFFVDQYNKSVVS